MKTTELALQIRDILRDDVDIAQWGQQAFGERVAVHLGMRLDNPLAADDYPVIVIPHIRRVYGESTGRERYHVALRAAVSNGGVETDMVAKTVVYLGLLQAEELRELACDALVRARFAKLDFEAETGNVVTYPEFVSLFAVTISTINIRRRLK